MASVCSGVKETVKTISRCILFAPLITLSFGQAIHQIKSDGKLGIELILEETDFHFNVE